MIKSLTKTLAAEWALHKHNKLNRRGVVDSKAQQFHVIRDVLPGYHFKEVLRDLKSIESHWVRSKTEWRRGSAIGGHELREVCSGEWLRYLFSIEFLEKARRATGQDLLQYVPVEDTNRLSLLRYEGLEGGDGIDWHVDGSIYLGQRWAGILTLLETTGEDTAKLEIDSNGLLTSFPKADIVNSLVLFRGDHVRHRVRPMLEGEERIVLSLLFSDWPQRTRNILLRGYQSKVNKVFYNNPNP
ncbi:MAG: hypothetical protein CMQ40_09435 [Gammaproteobacteria bacterium]|nr:hypothetical protein [Gammaproteobacteria bacterium]